MTNKRIQFKKLDEFRAAKAQRQDGSQRLYEQEMKAAEKVVELKTKYETLLTESVLEGREATEELDALNDEIKAVEETLKRRKSERRIFSAKAPKLVTEQDVVDAWNNDFLPQFKAEHIDPALDQMLEVKALWAMATINYLEKTDMLENYHREVYNEIGDGFKYRLSTAVGIKTRSDEDKFYISARDEQEVRRRKIPSVVSEYLKNRKGGNK